MIIRKTREEDIKEIAQIYDAARKYMKENGNPNQWENGYPDETDIRNDIQNGHSYVVDEEGEILGVFVFIIGEDPTYKIIEQGQWNADKRYGTIHRIASAGKMKGFTKLCFDYCISQIDYLRIDTHQNNQSMQNAIKKYGFRKCGMIHVRNGERIAFDYIVDNN